MNTQNLCFVNSENQRIQVTDEKSAQALKQLLGRLQDSSWVLEGDSGIAQIEELQDMFDLHSKTATVLPAEIQMPDQANAKTFRVILISGASSFRSGLREITAEGMKLKNTVPAHFNAKECVAYIGHDKMRENVEMVCSVTTDFDGTSWLEFVAPKSADLEKLTEWMAEPAV